MTVIDAKIFDNHFHLNGVNYFRGHADAVLLGDVGEKKTPATQQNYLAVQENVPRRQLKVQRALRIDLHAIDIDTRELKVGLLVPGLGRVEAGSAARQIEEQTLSLVKLEVLPKEIVAAANAAPDVLAELIRAGNGGRLVHQVFVLMQMKTAIGFTSAHTFSVTGSAGALNVVAGGTGGVSVELVPGSTFAYLLLEPKWDADLKKNWKRIDDWEDDQWSLY